MPVRFDPVSLQQAIEALVRPVLIASDFDGTLAPIVDDPDSAQANARAMAALRRLAQIPGVSVAIVSGRSLSDLDRMTGGLEGAAVIGEHGNARAGQWSPGSEGISDLAKLVRKSVAQHPGAFVEAKEHSVVFHYRTMERDLVERAIKELLEDLGQLDDVAVSHGKEIVELSLGSRDKADAIADLVDEFGVATTVFIGDDTTDEKVFAALRPDDIAIKVGDGPTVAHYRIPDVESVADVLERLAVLLGTDEAY